MGAQGDVSNADETTYGISMNVIGNLSSPITMPVLASQTYSALAKMYTGDSANNITFTLNPLPYNPIVQASGAP